MYICKLIILHRVARSCLALGSAVLGMALIPPWSPEQKLQRLEVEQRAGVSGLRGSC